MDARVTDSTPTDDGAAENEAADGIARFVGDCREPFVRVGRGPFLGEDFRRFLEGEPGVRNELSHRYG